MIRAAALCGLMLVAACHRNQAALTPDADAETRNATAAKTLADIAAADEAASRPLPPTARPRLTERTTDPAPTNDSQPDDSIPANDATASPQ